MRSHSSLVTLALVAVTTFVLVGHVFLGSGGAVADEPQSKTRPCACPATRTMPALPHKLSERDQIAALERLQYALSEIGDGSTYVWRRWHGRLSAIVHPTGSFKDRTGTVCRHIIVMLTSGKRTKKMEGIACRLPSGRWRLDG